MGNSRDPTGSSRRQLGKEQKKYGTKLDKELNEQRQVK